MRLVRDDGGADDDREPREPAGEGDDAPHVVVPHEQLAPETLARLLAEVALRDDTDYGDAPRTLDERVALARAALTRGELVIVYNPGTETVAVLPRAEVREA